MGSYLSCCVLALGLLKRAWHEIPDIVAGSALAISSIIGAIVVYNYRNNRGDFDIKRYRFDYTGELFINTLPLL